MAHLGYVIPKDLILCIGGDVRDEVYKAMGSIKRNEA